MEITTEPFYVYIYLDPRKPGIYKYGEYEFKYEPFYVGKGGGGDKKRYKRYNDHVRYAKRKNMSKSTNPHNYYKIRKILFYGKNPVIKIVKRFGFEEFALELEASLISLIGRSDLKEGPLTNKCDGGSGINTSDEVKKKISESLKGHIPWNRNKCIPDYQKKDIRETLLGLNKNKVKKPDLRPVHIVEKKEKIYVFSEERRRKISEKHKGRISPFKGTKTNKPAWNRGLKVPIGPMAEEERIKARDSVLNTRVAQYIIDGQLIRTYRSQRDAARITGLNREGIKDCCNGRQLSAYGYIWKKLNERYRKEIVQ